MGSLHMAVILSGVLALAVPLMRDVSLVLPSSGPEILSSHSPAPPHSIGLGLLEALLCFTADPLLSTDAGTMSHLASLAQSTWQMLRD